MQAMATGGLPCRPCWTPLHTSQHAAADAAKSSVVNEGV